MITDSAMYVFNDEFILKRVRHWLLLAGVMAFGILVLLVLALMSLYGILKDQQRDVIKAHVISDSMAVTQMLQEDLEAVKTLSTIAASDDFKPEHLVYGLKSVNLSFMNLGYCDLDRKCTLVRNNNGVVTSEDFKPSLPYLYEALERCNSGLPHMSEPHFSHRVNSYFIILAAPVLKANSVDGYVFWYKDFNDYAGLLSSYHREPGDALFIVNTEGEILTRSLSAGDQGKWVDAMFGDKQFSDKLYDARIRFLNKENFGEIAMVHKSDEGHNLLVYSRPLGVQDWYLVYTADEKNRLLPAQFRQISEAALLFTLLMGAIVVLGTVAYISLRRSALRQHQIISLDPLTGALTFNRFHYEISRLNFKDHTYAICVFNIRDFKYVNKFAGDVIADLLLRSVVNIASAAENMCFVCRSNADQFYFLLKGGDIEAARSTVQSIINALHRHFEFMKFSYPLICYAAVALSEPDDDTESLLQKALVAYRHISRKFSHTVESYTTEMAQKERNLRAHEQRMHIALEAKEFKLYLQPKIDVKTLKIVGAEALVRWELPDGSLVYPDSFIELFEQNGFATELDLYMFEQACIKIRQWIDSGHVPVPISINQTRNLLLYHEYPNRLRSILKRYHIPKHMLTVEMLEGEMAINIENVNNLITMLHSLGLKMSLDDFGSGYSSLNVLASMELDEIKFDKQFLLTKDKVESERNRFIISHMMQVVHMFKMKAVAEGVETEEDLEFLRSIGCDIAQGYYFDKPMTVDAFEKKYILPNGPASLNPGDDDKPEASEGQGADDDDPRFEIEEYRAPA